MATVESNGSGGGDWSAGATWDGGAVPAQADDVVILDGDTVLCDADLTQTGSITVRHRLQVKTGFTLTADGGIVLDGGRLEANDTGDMEGVVTVTANDGEINWGFGALTLTGSIDAGGHAVTHMWPGGDGELVLSGSVHLDTGATDHAAAPDIHVDATADVTLDVDCAAWGLDLTTAAADFDFGAAARTLTVGAGGFDHDGTTTIGTAGRLVVATDTDTGQWSTDNLNRLTVNDGVTLTMTGHVKLSAAAGDSALAGAGDIWVPMWKYLLVDIVGDDFWTLTGTVDGDYTVPGRYLPGVRLQCHTAGTHTNAAPIDCGGIAAVAYNGSNDPTVQLPGGLTCGELAMYANAGAYTLDLDGGDLAVEGDVLYDVDDNVLMLGSGSHAVGGDVKRADGDETGCELQLDTCLLALEGTLDADGITATHAGAQVRGGTVQNFALTDQRNRLRCRDVTEGSGVTNRSLLHLDRHPRGRTRRRGGDLLRV